MNNSQSFELRQKKTIILSCKNGAKLNKQNKYKSTSNDNLNETVKIKNNHREIKTHTEFVSIKSTRKINS